MIKYSIKVNKTGRYIDWYNGSWYGTSLVPQYTYTEEEAKDLAKKLRKCYIYDVTLIPADGSVEIPVSAFPIKNKVNFEDVDPMYSDESFFFG